MALYPQCADEVESLTHDCHKSSVAVQSTVPPADEVESGT